MGITTSDGLVAALAGGQTVQIMRSATRVSIAFTPFSVFDLAGDPGAGTLAGSSTAAGVVPTDATAGCPTLNDWSSGLGYLGRATFSWSVAGKLRLYDMLFKAGAYAFNAATSLASQPSFSGRVPGGTDYTGTQIWIEAVTAFTGNMSVAVTYTNQAGTTGRTTGTVATGTAPTVGRLIQLPLQAGDTGVSKIESVTATVATVGTFNVLVLRPVTPWARIRVANDVVNYNASDLGLPQVYKDSAFYLVASPDSTSTALPDVDALVING